MPPDYSLLDVDATYPKLEALIPEYNEPKVLNGLFINLGIAFCTISVWSQKLYHM